MTDFAFCGTALEVFAFSLILFDISCEQLSKPGRDFFYKSSKTKSLLQVLDLLILKDDYVFHAS